MPGDIGPSAVPMMPEIEKFALMTSVSKYSSRKSEIDIVQKRSVRAISLGPMLAREMAQREAVEGFWLGPWAGSVYYGWYPVHATAAETVATTLVVMGCFALYTIGRRGGEAFLRRRLQERHIERGLAMYRRFGLFAIVVPSLTTSVSSKAMR